MIKKSVLQTFLLLLFVPVVTAVNIRQILYDPLNSDTGGEAIEFYNPSNDDVDIGGWTIATSVSDQDVTFPKNTIIAAKSYFLVADVGWNTTKQSGWRNADYEETMTLPNSDSGIALKNKNGTIVDAVGWGNVSKEGLYLRIPAVEVAEGFSLLRVLFTNNNFGDFVASIPKFDVPQSVVVELEVLSPSVVIKKFEILDDDSNLSGTQIIPVAGMSRNITVRAQIDGATVAHVQFGDGVFSLSRMNNSFFQGTFELQHFLPPDNYSVMLVTEGSTVFVNFTYLHLKKFEVFPSVIRVSASPGETVSSESVVVKNTGNVPLNISVRLNELRGTNGSISTQSVSLMFGSAKKPAHGVVFSVLPGAEQQIQLSLNVPQDVFKGKYVSSLLFKDW